MIRKVISIIVLALLLLMPISAMVMGEDNLVQNGTFDTDMSGWNTQTSQNFSITSNAGVCDVNTTHTDWIFDQDYSLQNATLYNMTLRSGDPSVSGFLNYTDIDANQYEILNNTFDNYSLNGWEYQEQDQLSPFLRSNFSSSYNLSANLSLGAESIKLHNITDFDYNLTTEPSSIAIGNASTDYVYRNNQYECNWTGNRHSVRQWNISSRGIISGTTSNEYGMNMTMIANESGLQQLAGWIRIGYGNTQNTQLIANNDISLIMGRWNATHMRSRLVLKNNGGYQVSSFLSYWNYTNFTSGINITLYSSANSRLGYSIKDSSTDYMIANNLIASLNNFQINAIQIKNYYVGSSSISANITHLRSWLAPNNLPTTASSTFDKTISITNDSVRIDIETNRLHYHNSYNGLVRSAININTSQGSSELSNVSSTSTSTWYQTQDTVRNVTGNVTLSTWNYFSLAEGSTDFPAKGVYFDNLTITATEYDWNGSYESQIFDRDYYADWQQIEVYFNDTEGTYSPPSAWNTIFNITVYTRVGDHATVDGTWSGWQQVNNLQWYDVGMSLWQGDIASKNGEYFQYKMEVILWKRGLESPKFIFGQMSSIPMNTSMEWGSFDQNITKPYTNYTTLKYDYKIHELNNTINGTIGVYINGSLINQHNYTFFETAWQYVEIDLPTSYNASGIYNLNFTVITNFNATNGTSTIWFDNVEMLIEDQAPIITSFEVHDAIEIWFTGNFTDYSRGSDYQYLGASGIDTVNITIGGTVLEIDDYVYLGNGSFEFNYTWENTPFQIAQNQTINATLLVKDTADLQDQEIDSLTYPSVADFMVSILFGGMLVIFIILIILRHLATEWNTITPKHEPIMPTTLTGKRKW